MGGCDVGAVSRVSTAERVIVCRIESVRGRLVTLCGVEVEVEEIDAVEGLTTCPLCVGEQEERWANETAD